VVKNRDPLHLGLNSNKFAHDLAAPPASPRLGENLAFRGLTKMTPVLRATLLLIASNVFMTFAWYAHLRNLGDRKWYVAALVSWGIALFEYLLQVPANRIGYTALSLGQLKILQEVITLSVFVPFSVLYMKEPLRLDYLWAGICIMGAVYFLFRANSGG
jgi:uncharacterized protein (DUF486 family)